MTAAADRELLRQTFDTVAALYRESRPSYPDGLYDDLIRLARLAPDEDALLEIGCGPGQATIPLARWVSPSPPWNSAPRSPPRPGATWPASRG